jgi:hypothetical protein
MVTLQEHHQELQKESERMSENLSMAMAQELLIRKALKVTEQLDLMVA